MRVLFHVHIKDLRKEADLVQIPTLLAYLFLPYHILSEYLTL